MKGEIKGYKPWHRPTFPTGLPASIIGAGELNCRVRNGTGCNLPAMGTREMAIE